MTWQSIRWSHMKVLFGGLNPIKALHILVWYELKVFIYVCIVHIVFIEYIALCLICCCYCLVTSPVWLFVTSWTIAHQAPSVHGISQQEYWSGLPFPPPHLIRSWYLIKGSCFTLTAVIPIPITIIIVISILSHEEDAEATETSAFNGSGIQETRCLSLYLPLRPKFVILDKMVPFRHNTNVRFSN